MILFTIFFSHFRDQRSTLFSGPNLFLERNIFDIFDSEEREEDQEDDMT